MPDLGRWTMNGRGGVCNPSGNLRRARRHPDDRAMARRLSLDEGIDLFLDHVKVERGLARHTLEAYGRDLARFARFLSARRESLDVDDVTAEDVTDFLIDLAAAKLAARSRARTLVAVRG